MHYIHSPANSATVTIQCYNYFVIYALAHSEGKYFVHLLYTPYLAEAVESLGECTYYI